MCGAEINSVVSLVANGYAAPDATVFLFHSDTDDGRAIVAALTDYFRGRGHSSAEAVCIPDLLDSDPKRFRTKGLRSLARLIAAKIRDYTPAACAINAIGG